MLRLPRRNFRSLLDLTNDLSSTELLLRPGANLGYGSCLWCFELLFDVDAVVKDGLDEKLVHLFHVLVVPSRADNLRGAKDDKGDVLGVLVLFLWGLELDSLDLGKVRLGTVGGDIEAVVFERWRFVRVHLDVDVGVAGAFVLGHEDVLLIGLVVHQHIQRWPFDGEA